MPGRTGWRWLAALLLMAACADSSNDVVSPSFKYGPPGGGGGGGDEGFGSNLSVPVIFVDNLNLAGGTVIVGDEASTGLRPNGDQAALAAGITALPWFYVGNTPDLGEDYFCQRTENTWMAQWAIGNGAPMDVKSFWGDNLTSQQWNINAQVRVEVNLQPVTDPGMTGYNMPYAYGTKNSEIKCTDGTTAVMPSYVYTHHACLRIEKITDPKPADPVFFDGCVDDEVPDGPGGYAAEVNVSGLVTYGYNWTLGSDTRFTAEQKAGTWRLTYYVESPGLANIVPPADAGGKYGTPVVGPGNQTSLEIVISSNKSKKPANPGGGGGETN